MVSYLACRLKLVYSMLRLVIYVFLHFHFHTQSFVLMLLRGTVSIVHVNLSDVSESNASSLRYTTTSLVMYHNLIEKAKWANYGHDVQQDIHGAHSIIFDEAGDAVKFCLQVRQI